MKSVLMTLLLAGQIVSYSAMAAPVDYQGPNNVEAGTFAGARFRLPLGGGARTKPKLDLAFAPMMRSQSQDGRSRMRFGEGIGLGVTGEGPVRLSMAGQPLSSFASGRAANIPDRDKRGISTLGAVGIGVGVALVGAVVFFAIQNRNYESCGGGC